MNTRLPLTGIRVLDLSALTPGPFATTMLAELGASVVKVERPGGGDPLRAMLPRTFEILNRGKVSIEIDMKSQDDLEVLQGLCDGADVVIEGFRPGVADRLGVGFADVADRNSSVVYVSVSGYGQVGPLAQAAGHDLNYVAQAGGVGLSGVDGTRPGYDGTYQIADLAGAAYTVIGILAALQDTARTAVHLDVSLWGSALSFSQLAAAEAADSGHAELEVQRPYGARGANGVFFDYNGAPFTVSAVEDGFWSRLTAILGDPALDSPDFVTYNGRLRNGAELNSRLSQIFATHSRQHWLSEFEVVGVPSAPVLTWNEALADPHTVGSDVLTARGDPTSVPVSGLSRRELGDAPALDSHGEQLRAQGWNSLAPSNTEGAR